MNRLFAIEVLTEKAMAKARAMGADTLLFNETESDFSGEKDITLHNCSADRVRATWHTWKSNKTHVEALKKKHPALFVVHGYDLTLAIERAAFWNNFRRGYLDFGRTEHFAGAKVLELPALYPGRRLRTYAKYIRRYLKGRSSARQPLSGKGHTMAIHIRSEFQLRSYHDLLVQLKQHSRFVVFVDQEKIRQQVIGAGIPPGNIELVVTGWVPARLPLLSPFSISGGEWYVLGQVLDHLDEMEKWVARSQTMMSRGLSSILINEGENTLYGAVLSEVAGHAGVKVYNTMNGIKAGQAQDAHVNFHRWFVWDQKMKELLVRRCGLPGEMFLVCGHLMEDMISRHRYSGSIDLAEDIRREKKIISVFSVPGRRPEKIFTFDYLYRLAAADSSLHILVRPHPSEQMKDLPAAPENLENVQLIRYTPETSKTTLYDQLAVSTLSIVFGSTVAIESVWCSVPCITVESRPESIIYAADNNKIFHARDVNMLDQFCRSLLPAARDKARTGEKNVAACILSNLSALN